MTRLLRCDKCGKEFHGFFNTKIETYTYIEFTGHIRNPDKDICSDCEKLLMNWIDEK